MTAKTKFTRDELIKRLGNFKFNENISFSDIIKLWKGVDSEYNSFSMSNQIKRIYLLPYTVLFYTNDTVILNSFIDFFEELQYLVKTSVPSRRFEEASPRLIVHSNMILMDVFPTSKLRYNAHLYVLNPNDVILDDSSLEELDEFQELELRKYKNEGPVNFYTPSKQI